MLWWSVIFFLIAGAAAIIGWGGIQYSGSPEGVAQILFFVFLILASLSIVFGYKAR